MSDLSHHLVKTEHVIGVNVINHEKESLGKIEELVLDKHNGQVTYAVLSFGGIMGIGDKLFALPWKALSYNEDEKAFELRQSKERLKNAPGFDKDKWPNMADNTWKQDIEGFYEL